MDSFNDVLDAVKLYCKDYLVDATYNLYIEGLQPMSFEDSNHVVLSVRNDFICKIVRDRYIPLLKEAFKAVLGFEVNLDLVVPELPATPANDPDKVATLPSGRYDFTFENFIQGSSNRFAYAAAQAVAANPSGA